MSEIVHVSAAKDGSVLQFPFSAKYWLKVCSPSTGIGGVVDLTNGAYYSVSEIERLGGLYCRQVFRDLNECFYGESED